MLTWIGYIVKPHYEVSYNQTYTLFELWKLGVVEIYPTNLAKTTYNNKDYYIIFCILNRNGSVENFEIRTTSQKIMNIVKKHINQKLTLIENKYQDNKYITVKG